MGSDPASLTPLARRALWALLLGGLVGFILLALAYEHDPFAAIDRETAEWVSAGMPTWAESLARPPSWIGGWIGITAIGIALGVALVRERAWLDLGFLLATFAGSQIVVALLKDWFDRPRPDFGSAVGLPSSASFPSGHATAGAASLGAVAVLVAERLPSQRARLWLWALVVTGGLAIGVSRVVLNVHYVSDVLAGWCLGVAWLAACLLAREGLRDRIHEV
ncbi:MAG: phosphatase PAP2 family protein [Thermoleophilia bacterium]|nr:phosphatase PAP2 family protein [Thermoleophilia bacterium]MDH4339156.1 phosphatase PAP2 family protein [Thermoleophilia bacterium]MDH5280600.1 phosphatase PAP2 family protein [Thermoleophilia bacterium]